MLENRKSYRLPLRTKMIFSDGQTVLVGNVLNISMDGIFVSMASTPTVSRDAQYKCLFNLSLDQSPVCISGQVKRIVALSANPEIYPGIGLAFSKDLPSEVEKVEQYILDVRKCYELVITILSSGDPDWATLAPIVNKLHLPPFQGLNDLKFMVERVIKSFEMVDQRAHIGV